MDNHENGNNENHSHVAKLVRLEDYIKPSRARRREVHRRIRQNDKRHLNSIRHFEDSIGLHDE